MVRDKSEELLEIIKDKALSFGEVTLSSGIKSNFYVDARVVTLSSQGAYLTATLILDLLRAHDFDAVGGPAIGADPILGAIAALSWQRNEPVDTFIVRKNAKGYGKKKQFEGPLKQNSKVVVVDDVLTTGNSIVEAIEAVENFGCEVVKVVVLVDRSKDAAEKIKAQGYNLQALFTQEDLGLSS